MGYSDFAAAGGIRWDRTRDLHPTLRLSPVPRQAEHSMSRRNERWSIYMQADAPTATAAPPPRPPTPPRSPSLTQPWPEPGPWAPAAAATRDGVLLLIDRLHECKSRIQRTTGHLFAYFHRVAAHAAGCRDSARTARRAAQRVRHNAAGLCSSGRVALSAAHTRCTEERAPLAEQWCSARRSECNGSARRSLSSGAAYIAEELAHPCYTAATASAGHTLHKCITSGARCTAKAASGARSTAAT